jgi:alpha-galactosidase
MSRSGVPLFISAEPSQVTPEIKTAMREAFARAIRPKPSPEPLDWIETRSPTRWRCQLERKIYDWSEKT